MDLHMKWHGRHALSTIGRALMAGYTRSPRLRRAVLAAWTPMFRLALFPFWRPQGRGVAREDLELVRRTDDYNRAAERYFAEFPNPQYQFDKPFSDVDGFAKHLINLGTLINGAGIHPGHTVLDFGAGACWLSHLLNRHGCRTIAVDVSETALFLGQRLFREAPQTNWALDPQFLTYDGHTLPLDDEAVDRIVVYDAFHHVPNQREILTELHRVLKPDGVIAMSEPGPGHSTTPHSIAEASTGVLENDLVLEDVTALAESVGLTMKLIVAAPHVSHAISPKDIGRFKGGYQFRLYWRLLCRHSLDDALLLLGKSTQD